MALPGFVDGQRFEPAERQMRPGGADFGRYVALYRVHTSDLTGVFKEMNRSIATGRTNMNAALDMHSLHGFTYQAIRAPVQKPGTASLVPTYVHLVFTEGKPGQDEEYNRW